jgi:hypothetical protein
MKLAILASLMLVASATPALAHRENIGERSNREAYRDVYRHKHRHHYHYHVPRHRHCHWHGDGTWHCHRHRKYGGHHGHADHHTHSHWAPFLQIEIH